MRGILTASAFLSCFLATASAALAEPPSRERDRQGEFGRRHGDWSGDEAERSGRSQRHYYRRQRPSHWGGAYRVPVPYPYPAYPGYYPPYPGYYPPYYLPPVVLPAEELYGPGAVQRFMGVDHWFQPQQPQSQPPVIIQRDVGEAAQPQPQPAAEPDEEKPGRATNRHALNLAWRFLGFGDAHFGNQNYSEANDRYRKAATAAPLLADSYFRQGYALMAMGRYEHAVRTIRRGMDLDADWPRSDFHNAELYSDNPQAKAAQLETLATAAEKDPHNADLLFLVGVMLHFDGKPERARPFFERAGQLLAGNDAHVRAFLEE